MEYLESIVFPPILTILGMNLAGSSKQWAAVTIYLWFRILPEHDTIISSSLISLLYLPTAASHGAWISSLLSEFKIPHLLKSLHRMGATTRKMIGNGLTVFIVQITTKLGLKLECGYN